MAGARDGSGVPAACPSGREGVRPDARHAAGLDVYEREPLPGDHELLALDNAVLLPHLGYVSEDSLRAMYAQAVEDIAAFVGGSPIRVLT